MPVPFPDAYDEACVAMAKHITEAKVNVVEDSFKLEPLNEIGACDSGVDAIRPVLWKNGAFNVDVDAMTGITKEMLVSGQEIMAMQPMATIGDASRGSLAGAAPSPHSDAKAELDMRIYQVGYNLQRLEEIRREIKSLGLTATEKVINAAIEDLADAWLTDRRRYRDMP